MKLLHRKDLFGWSDFNRERNLDFHCVLWVRDGGNVLIDPLPMSEHDHSHL
ncbi:MAG: MBL fold metallo-hydrolase, partial [Methylobacter sp.]|nr:MBL fold metallo-hydrolase [Methylobacter sp.]